VKKVHVASGIRMDLAADEPDYLAELAEHHVGGHLKVAPEHVSERVLQLMKKPAGDTFDRFARGFEEASERAGREQYLVPYFIASHPGSGSEEMIELALYLKRNGYRPRQVQDFIPAPMDIATCMYWTGIDPETMEPVSSARTAAERAEQRALLQYWKPENHALVARALRRAGRADLIGSGPDCLIPDRLPGAHVDRARRARRRGPEDGSRTQEAAAGQPRPGGSASSATGYRGSARRRGAGRR